MTLYAAAAAKSHQLCLTLYDPIDSSPPGSTIPGILQARTLEWVAISFSKAWKWKVKVKSLSRPTLSDPMDCSPLGARQQKRHRCKEQTFGLCGSRRRWNDLREHWNMYITTCEINPQSRFNAWDRVLRAGALGWPWGMGCGGRWERFRMEDACILMIDSCQCMAKTTTIL